MSVISDAPIITSQHDPLPGESMTILGDNLDDADFMVWIEGRLIRADAMRTAWDRAQLAIPKAVSSVKNGSAGRPPSQ